MKIIIINGSPRVKGSTAKILHAIQEKMDSYENVTTYYYNLATLKFDFCKGCSLCFKSGKCIINDDFEKLCIEIANADGIVIGSPTYASNVSGQLKTFIDRGHFVLEQLLDGKYTMGVITSENYGGKDVEKYLKTLFTYSGAYTTSMIQKKLNFSNSPTIDEKLAREIEQKTEKMVQAIHDQRQYPLQRIKHNVIFNVGIKPFVLKKGLAYEGVVKAWKEKK